jgi:hypothetical protein
VRLHLLFVCETWSSTLMKQCRLTVYEDMVMKKIKICV